VEPVNVIWTCGACGGVMSHRPDCALVAPAEGEAMNDYDLLGVTISWLVGWSWTLILLWAALGAGRLGAD
jgi:hypothetical protein